MSYFCRDMLRTGTNRLIYMYPCLHKYFKQTQSFCHRSGLGKPSILLMTGPDGSFVSIGACNLEVPGSNPSQAGYLSL